jgi:Uma2 family endonuclease
MVAQLTIEEAQVLEQPQEEEIQLYTFEEFLELPEPDNGSRYELSGGELIEVGVTGHKHSKIQRTLDTAFTFFLKDSPIGELYPNTGFRLAERTYRAPDLTFLQTAKIPPVGDTSLTVPPDLAIEIISPTDDWSAIIKKVREYQQAEVPLIWLIDPYMPCVMLFHQKDTYPTILKLDDELDGEDVVKGFKLIVSALFDY